MDFTSDFYKVAIEKAMEGDLSGICRVYGGEWCDCIDRVIEKLTPRKLAAYCIAKKYPDFPKPTADELGTRYGYLLRTVRQLVNIPGEKEGVEKNVNIVAAFGEFTHRPLETIQSVLNAIQRIAAHEGRSAQAVALDCLAADESVVPVPVAPGDSPPAVVPSVRRFVQSSQGIMPAG
jgi:hypothetical protein